MRAVRVRRRRLAGDLEPPDRMELARIARRIVRESRERTRQEARRGGELISARCLGEARRRRAASPARHLRPRCRSDVIMPVMAPQCTPCSVPVEASILALLGQAPSAVVRFWSRRIRNKTISLRKTSATDMKRVDSLHRPMSDSPSSQRMCPSCGGPLLRVRRHALGRLLSLVRPVARYRCRRPDCAWQGNLARPK